MFFCGEYCYSCMLCDQRGSLRGEFGIEGSAVVDFAVSFCCPLCVIGQHRLELKSRFGAQKAVVVAPTQNVVVTAVPVGAPEDVSMSR